MPTERPTCNAKTLPTGLGYKPPGSSGGWIRGHVCGRRAVYEAHREGFPDEYRCRQHAVRDNWVKWMGYDGEGHSEYLIVWAGVVRKIPNRPSARESSYFRE